MGNGRPVKNGFKCWADELTEFGTAASKASSAKEREAFGDRPGGFTELPGTWVTFDAVGIGFDDDEFEADAEVRLGEVRDDEVIAEDLVKGDVTFSADLGIGSAGFFEVEREWGNFFRLVHGVWSAGLG